MATAWTKKLIPIGGAQVEGTVILKTLPGQYLVAEPDGLGFSTNKLYGVELDSNFAEDPYSPRVWMHGNSYAPVYQFYLGNIYYYRSDWWIFKVPIESSTDKNSFFFCYLIVDIGKEADVIPWEFIAFADIPGNKRIAYPPASTKLQFSLSVNPWSGATFTRVLGGTTSAPITDTFTHKVDIMDFADTSPDWPDINNFPLKLIMSKIRFIHDRQAIVRYGDLSVIDTLSGGTGGGGYGGPGVHKPTRAPAIAKALGMI